MNVFIPTISLLIHAAFEQNKKDDSKQNLEGFRIFISSPNLYVLSFGNWLGKIIDASLDENGKLTIEYFFQKNGKKLLGKLIGEYDEKKNQFLGFQYKEKKITIGKIELSFKDNGEAKGTWKNGKGNVTMLLD